MGYKEQNNKNIIRAFGDSARRLNETVRIGFISLLEAGVAYCLAEHDPTHQRHLETGDSYGWVLLYKGKEIDRRIFAEGVEAKGNASRQLDKVKGQCPSFGWCGVVLAGLEPANYFNVRYEFIPMRAGFKDLTSDDFEKYFQPMAV